MKKADNGIHDPDLCQVEAALKRAAVKARELGERTQTPVFVLREGKIVNLLGESEEAQKGSQQLDSQP